MVEARHLRFAIDNGGTFTDMVVLDEDSGEFWLEKAPTTPHNTLIGLLDVIEKAKLDLAQVSRFFVHGSTMAVNALLQRKGVKTACITTKGFSDVPAAGIGAIRGIPAAPPRGQQRMLIRATKAAAKPS